MHMFKKKRGGIVYFPDDNIVAMHGSGRDRCSFDGNTIAIAKDGRHCRAFKINGGNRQIFFHITFVFGAGNQ